MLHTVYHTPAHPNSVRSEANPTGTLSKPHANRSAYYSYYADTHTKLTGGHMSEAPRITALRAHTRPYSMQRC